MGSVCPRGVEPARLHPGTTGTDAVEKGPAGNDEIGGEGADGEGGLSQTDTLTETGTGHAGNALMPMVREGPMQKGRLRIRSHEYR